MKIDQSELQEIISLVVAQTIQTLEDKNMLVSPNHKTAYQKTEQLLYNYRGFKRIVDERMREIDELRKYGVPQKAGAITERVQNGSLPQGIVLMEESVEAAVQTVQRSVQSTVQVISLIDKAMYALRNDPYYSILEMRYFEGRTQEDIALELNCAQQTVSKNKNRLVRELAMRLFPDQVAQEMME